MSLLFFDFGSGEIMLIVLAIFLIFGPDKIPGMARSLGKFINEVKRASEDIKTEINREADKKERKQKLEEYKNKIQSPDNGLKSQPRGATTMNEKSEAESETGSEKVNKKKDKPEKTSTEKKADKNNNNNEINHKSI